METSVESLPRVIILAKKESLAGDLSAWLSARFNVEATASATQCRLSLLKGASAMIILSEECGETEASFAPLARRALAEGCRVIQVGGDLENLRGPADSGIVHFPDLPSPSQIYEHLQGLT